MKKTEKRKATNVEAWSTIIFMIVCLAVGCSVFGFDLKMMMLTSCIFSLLIVWRLGYSWGEIQENICSAWGNVGGMFIVFFGIGFLIASWMCSGTAPVLVLWLAKLVAPEYALVLSFVLVAILSALIGTSFGSMGTLGIVMFSICQVQGIPASISAAAVICGAFVGSYISPVSDFFNLNALLNKVSVSRMIKENALSVGLGALITSAFFFILGTKYSQVSSGALDGVAALAVDIQKAFPYTGVLVVIPMVVCIVLCILKKPAPVALFLSGISAILIGIFAQGFSLAQCLDAVYNGFSSSRMISTEIGSVLSTLLNRGGILSMGDGMIFFMFSVANIALIQLTGIFDRLVKLFLGSGEKKSGVFKLNCVISLFSIFFTAAAGDGSPMATITASSFRERYIEAGYDPSLIATFSNLPCNIPTMYLPWSFCAWYSATIYGVSVGDYVPYAIMFWAIPAVGLILSALGIGNTKLQPDTEK